MADEQADAMTALVTTSKLSDTTTFRVDRQYPDSPTWYVLQEDGLDEMSAIAWAAQSFPTRIVMIRTQTFVCENGTEKT